jgi:hypothetical protein
MKDAIMVKNESSLTSFFHLIRRTLVPIAATAGVLLLALLACNAPVQEQTTAAADTTAAETAEPTASNTPLPSATPTPDVDAMLSILDSYPSLETVRLRLDAMRIAPNQGGEPLTGRQMLEWILGAQHYDPRSSNAVNEQLFAALDDYTFPHPGARIYLVSVATGLYVEAYGLVPWSLGDYSRQEIENLFIEDDSYRITDSTLHRGDLPDMPNVTWHTYSIWIDKIIEDAHYKQFNLAHRLTADAATQREAVLRLVDWYQQNFFHAIAPDYTWAVYLDGREPLNNGGPVAYPLSIERIYEERVNGCHEPTTLIEGMLHSLNVPALRLMVHGHGVLYLPTMDRYVHGDHIIGGTNVPPEMRLYTPDEFRPFAEDVAWIYQISRDKYQPPLSMPLKRDGGNLYIYADRVFPFPDTSKCIDVSDEEWARMSAQTAAYNVRYDTEACVISSDMVPILTLAELSAPEP